MRCNSGTERQIGGHTVKQSSTHNASFVYLETANAHMAGGSVSFYDPSTAPGGKVTFQDILDNTERRLHLAQMFRRKLVRVPMDLDYPYWVDDANFDLEYHIREIGLPKPGDWRQLCIQTARLMARPLDLNKPLWEMYVIEGIDAVEGVPKGSFAVVSKTHHATMDGASGMEMLTALHDLTPDAPEPEAQPWTPEREPAPAELMARTAANNFARPGRYAAAMARAFGDAQQRMWRGELPQVPGDAPPAPLVP